MGSRLRFGDLRGIHDGQLIHPQNQMQFEFLARQALSAAVRKRAAQRGFKQQLGRKAKHRAIIADVFEPNPRRVRRRRMRPAIVHWHLGCVVKAPVEHPGRTHHAVRRRIVLRNPAKDRVVINGWLAKNLEDLATLFALGPLTHTILRDAVLL